MTELNYGIVESLSQLRHLVSKMLEEGLPIGLDCETGYDGPDKAGAQLHPEEGFVVGISFTNSLKWARYLPLHHDYYDNIDNVAAAEIMRPMFESGLVVAHNAFFEERMISAWFREHLKSVQNRGYFPVLSDTMIECARTGLWKVQGLKALVYEIFGHKMTDFLSLFPGAPKNKEKALRFNILELTPEVVSYACEDALWCLALHYEVYPKVKDNSAYRLEMSILQEVMPDLHDDGIILNWQGMREYLKKAQDFSNAQYSEIQKELSDMLGRQVTINLNSPQQVSKVLYEDLGFSTTRMTKSSQDSDDPKMSTDAKALEGLANEQPVVRKILEWKEVRKLIGSYLEKYERDFAYDTETGKAHPQYNQCWVISGRFSCSEPNIQQLPAGNFETPEGKKITRYTAGDQVFEMCFRDFVEVPEGWYGLGFDYSAAELRALAGESGEPELLDAFENGVDVHKRTAALLYNITEDEVTKIQRKHGKAQPLDSQVLTPQGYRRFGDLKVGDEVIGSNGRATKVTGIHPQGMKDCYSVRTSDGQTECCDEHLWTTRNTNTHSGVFTTKTLSSLMKAGLKNNFGQAKYGLPARPVVQFQDQKTPEIEPYVLGLLLGDGGFTHDWGVMFASADKELLEAVSVEHQRLGGRIASYTEQSSNFWRFYLASDPKGSKNATTQILRDLNLWMKRDFEKYVPQRYLLASPTERLALLQGLLDTDGCPKASGASFSSCSEHLSRDVQFLVRSLGGFASVTRRSSKPNEGFNGPSPKDCWEVYLRIPNVERLFRLDRKEDKRTKATRSLGSHLQRAEFVGSKEMQCISVEAEDGLYLTDDFILTHNTLNFQILYGSGIKSLGESLGISYEQAEDLYYRYMSVYSKIADYIQERSQFGKQHGYVVSKFGRKMRIWEYDDSRAWVRAKADRMAVNCTIQSSATGDYPKIAMVRAKRAIKAAGLDDKIRLIMNCHDALEFYVHSSVSIDEVISILEPAVVFPVPGWPRMVADWHTWMKYGSPEELSKNENGSWVVKEEKKAAPKVEHPDTQEYVQGGANSLFHIELLSGSVSRSRWDSFIALLDSNPGDSQVIVKMPQGELKLPKKTSLSVEDAYTINRLLGDCVLSYKVPTEIGEQ